MSCDANVSHIAGQLIRAENEGLTAIVLIKTPFYRTHR